MSLNKNTFQPKPVASSTFSGQRGRKRKENAASVKNEVLSVKVKKKTPAEIERIAEQLLREAEEQYSEISPPPQKLKISNPEEPAEYQLRNRKVRNKTPAEILMRAEQLLREVEERYSDISPPPPKQKKSDPEELVEYLLQNRKEIFGDEQSQMEVLIEMIKKG